MTEPTISLDLLPVFLARLVRRGVVTVDPAAAKTCCGFERDDDGFCSYKPGHPIFVRVS